MLTITFRFLHFAGHVLSFRSLPADEGVDFNWNRAQALRTLSYVIILIVFPAFTFWGVIGTVWFMDANDSNGNCFTDFEEYSFIIFWLIVTYIWIIAYVLLLALTALTYYRGIVMKRSLVAFLRKIDFEDNDLFESTRTNIMEENQRRRELIRILNEYGIYFLFFGLTQGEITWMEIVNVKRAHITRGFSRCTICLHDYAVGERVRLFPGCGHVYHLKCSQLWLEIEGSCPICLRAPYFRCDDPEEGSEASENHLQEPLLSLQN